MAISIVTAYRNVKDIQIQWLKHMNKYLKPYIDVEVIVVNNGQEEKIPVEEYLKPHSGTVRRIDVPKPVSYCEVMNVGLREAKGDYVIVMGNDMFPTKIDWISQLIYWYEDSDAWVISPLNKEDRRPWYDAGNYVGVASWKEYKGVSLSSGCWMMRKDRLIMFDEAYKNGFGCEDDDVCQQIKAKGGKMVLALKVVMDHRHNQGEAANSDDLSNERNLAIFKKRWSV